MNRLNFDKILLIGLLVRIALMPFIAHPFDVYAWYGICSTYLNNGSNIIDALYSICPFWLLTLFPIAHVYGFFSSLTGLKPLLVENLPSQMNPQWGISLIPDPLFNFVVKLPMLISDTIIAILLYKLTSRHYGTTVGIRAATFFYLNPAVIWISAAWGQYDSIPTLFTILSLYLLLNEKVFSSALSLLTATFYKAYPIGFIITFVASLFKRRSYKNLIKFLSLFIVSGSTFLILGWKPLIEFLSETFSTKTFHGIFGFGLTYWSISLLHPLDVKLFNPVSIFLTIFLITVSIFFILKAQFDDKLRDFALSATLIAGSIFLSYRYPTEQRFLWIAPFLAILTSNRWISEKIFWLLSATAFLYMQKNFPYYLLPIAILTHEPLKPLFQLTNSFRDVSNGIIVPTTLSAGILAILGTLFSVLLSFVYLQAIKRISSTLWPSFMVWLRSLISGVFSSISFPEMEIAI